MMLATLTDVLGPARAVNHAVAGFVILGWEDARACVEAAEETGQAVILQAGPGCRAHTPTPVIGKMLRHLAERASVPVVCHLDHARSFEECAEGVNAGFTSVMFDGSDLPLRENIETTARIVEFAHAAGVSVEGEVGFVGYADGRRSVATAPDDAGRFEAGTGADALAVSIGNVHLLTSPTGDIDIAALRAIEARTSLPLVLHGGSGIGPDLRRRLARETRVCKINIGTELRMAFGAALRESVMSRPGAFDRIELLTPTIAPVRAAAVEIIRQLQDERP
jgi:fructose-bisphosphate aldolase, class II